MGEYGMLNELVSASLKMNSFNYSPSVFSMLWLMNRTSEVISAFFKKKNTNYRDRIDPVLSVNRLLISMSAVDKSREAFNAYV
jgi:hypothetical protein